LLELCLSLEAPWFLQLLTAAMTESKPSSVFALFLVHSIPGPCDES